MVSEKFY